MLIRLSPDVNLLFYVSGKEAVQSGGKQNSTFWDFFFGCLFLNRPTLTVRFFLCQSEPFSTESFSLEVVFHKL